jgi:hypothetical protein
MTFTLKINLSWLDYMHHDNARFSSHVRNLIRKSPNDVDKLFDWEVDNEKILMRSLLLDWTNTWIRKNAFQSSFVDVESEKMWNLSKRKFQILSNIFVMNHVKLTAGR